MDAKLWTVGATLFALLYLTLAVSLVWSAVVVALILAAWVMTLETEGPEGLRYVQIELRPALSMVGVFALAVVVLGPHFPYVVSRNLYPIQYSSSLAVLHQTPVLFYFPLVPLLTGAGMAIQQSFHPVQGIVYQTPSAPSTRVHVHLHDSRASARARDEDDEEEVDEEEEAPRSKHRHPLHHRIRRPSRVHAKAHAAAEDDDSEEEDDEDEEESPAPRRRHHHALVRDRQSAEL